MNEQLQNALAELLGKTIDGIDSGVAFMQSELPDVIQQLLTWYAVKSAAYMIFAIAISVLWVKAEFYLNRKIRDDSGEIIDIDSYFIVYLVGGSIFRVVLFVVTLVMFNITWLQIWIAPKIWLIEYAANLAK